MVVFHVGFSGVLGRVHSGVIGKKFIVVFM